MLSKDSSRVWCPAGGSTHRREDQHEACAAAVLRVVQHVSTHVPLWLHQGFIRLVLLLLLAEVKWGRIVRLSVHTSHACCCSVVGYSNAVALGGGTKLQVKHMFGPFETSKNAQSKGLGLLFGQSWGLGCRCCLNSSQQRDCKGPACMIRDHDITSGSRVKPCHVHHRESPTPSEVGPDVSACRANTQITLTSRSERFWFGGVCWRSFVKSHTHLDQQ